ncbi:MAG: RluA family pseudouridine synthase [Mycoplasmataceae bacterium]|jgi:23S rRNA pseudouridine955/2504/2580 synthase|nr:RluA family pseudouridine synthase [Mycoplasmataceae bacterium]
MKNITITDQDDKKRIDKFLLDILKGMSFQYIQKNIYKGTILLNNKKIKLNDKIRTNDVLTINLEDKFIRGVKPNIKEHVDLDIIYEDNNILVINKPCGLSSHQDANNYQDSIIQRVNKYLGFNGGFSPQLCNRLDRNTSGLILIGKNKIAHTTLNKKIADHEINKFYLCKIHGHFEKKENVLKDYLSIKEDGVIISHRKENNEFIQIITEYKNIEIDKNGDAIIEINLLTGKKHQIRAHMFFYGHPLFNEKKYTYKDFKNKSSNQMLFSYKLEFNFITDANEMNYLKNKIISLDKNKIIEDLRKI